MLMPLEEQKSLKVRTLWDALLLPNCSIGFVIKEKALLEFLFQVFTRRHSFCKLFYCLDFL
jgi:hypothetical protein